MSFSKRHIGSSNKEQQTLLKTIGFSSVDELIQKTIPADILLAKNLEIPSAISENDWLKEAKQISLLNKNFRSYIGMGYYNTITPPVILRNIFENPGWYTAYTPYQAEISQGRLEAILNFQTMVMDLTGMEIANGSLLDESTAAAEAMMMLFNSRRKEALKLNANLFFVDENVFPQTIAVLETRSKCLGIQLIKGNAVDYKFNEQFFGALVQYPNAKGEIIDYTFLSEQLNIFGAELVVASDLLSLCLIKEPSKMGAGVVVGNSQRFGVPIGFGGPHAAFFACKEEFKRNMPGRIIGVSKDVNGKTALRMALQTREQHIKREKATSNICTAQALLASMASMYAVYHGAEGVKEIALQVAHQTKKLAQELEKLDLKNNNKNYFDTLSFTINDRSKLKEIAEKNEVNFFYGFENQVVIALDESVNDQDLNTIVAVFSTYLNRSKVVIDGAIELKTVGFSSEFERKTTYLQHPVFNSYHSETNMMRYLKRLENKDISLVHSMISLGSCTMKLNAASEMMPLSWPEFNAIHPFVPENQTLGYQKVFADLGDALKKVTGFAGISFQPNSGAQGEYAGLMVIKAYLESKGEHQRKVILIPSSAHGTNPASAVVAGFQVVVTKCDENGNIDIQDLKDKAEQNQNELAGLMVTYPSTHGVFEEGIKQITQLIHDFGGQVYMDGANMNAQVGLTNPFNIGADVCHLNLHKTFAIPHGGGGPGMGPIGVAKHLVPFLPNHPLVKVGGEKSMGAMSAAPYSSALILLISLGYVKLLGAEGLKSSTEQAILNANYLKHRLSKYYPILYSGKNNTVAHEMILDCRPFKLSAGIEVMDIAKRLIDYGFHAPTVSFPVAGTLMIEPTESESLAELDLFAEAMISIANEIDEITKGIYSKDDNVLINAPHPADVLLATEWQHSYTREKAAYPLNNLKENKYWVPVSRVDNAFGDRNLVCSCPEISEYGSIRKVGEEDKNF